MPKACFFSSRFSNLICVAEEGMLVNKVAGRWLQEAANSSTSRQTVICFLAFVIVIYFAAGIFLFFIALPADCMNAAIFFVSSGYAFIKWVCMVAEVNCSLPCSNTAIDLEGSSGIWQLVQLVLMAGPSSGASLQVTAVGC